MDDKALGDGPEEGGSVVGKWSETTRGLPKFMEPNKSFRDKVEERKKILLGPHDVQDGDMADERLVQLYTDFGNIAQDLEAHLDSHWADLGKARYPHAYAETRRAYKQIQEIEKRLNVLKTAYEQILINDFEQTGVETMRIAAGTLSYITEPHAVVKDKKVFLEWCKKDKDLAEVLALPWQKTNELMKARLEAGKNPMPGVEAFNKDKIRFQRR